MRASFRPRALRVLRRLTDKAARDWLLALAVAAWAVASVLSALVVDGVCARALVFGQHARERCDSSFGLWMPAVVGAGLSFAVVAAAAWWRMCVRRTSVPVLDQPLAEARSRAWDASIVWRRANLLWMAAPAHEAAVGSFVQAWRQARGKVSEALQRVRAADREVFASFLRMGGSDGSVGSGAEEVTSALEAASRSLLAAAAESHRLPGETEQLLRAPAAVGTLADQVLRLRRQAASDGGQFMAAAVVGAVDKDPAWIATEPPVGARPETVRSIVADLKRSLQRAEEAAAQQLEKAEAVLAACQSVQVRPLRVVWDAGERVEPAAKSSESPDSGAPAGSHAGSAKGPARARAAVLAAAEAEFSRLGSERTLPKAVADAVAKGSGSALLKSWQKAVRAATGHDPGQSLELVFTQPGFARCGEPGTTTSHRVQVASAPFLATWPWQRVLRAVSGLDPATCPALDRSSAPASVHDTPRQNWPAVQAWLAKANVVSQALWLADYLGLVPKRDGPLWRCISVPQRGLLRLGSAMWAQFAGLREVLEWLPRSLGMRELWLDLQAQDDSTLAPHPPGTTALVSPARPGTLWSGLFGDRVFEAIVSSAADQVAGTYFLSSSFEEFVLRRLRALGALRAALALVLWSALWTIRATAGSLWPNEEALEGRAGLGHAALAAVSPGLANIGAQSSPFRTALAMSVLASLAAAGTAVLSPLLAANERASGGSGGGRAARWRLWLGRLLASARDAAGWITFGVASGVTVVAVAGPSWVLQQAPAVLLGCASLFVGVGSSWALTVALPRDCRGFCGAVALVTGVAGVLVASTAHWTTDLLAAQPATHGAEAERIMPPLWLLLQIASWGCVLAGGLSLWFGSRQRADGEARDADGRRRGGQWCCTEGVVPELRAGNPAIGMPQGDVTLLDSFVRRGARRAVVARAEARALGPGLPGWASRVLPSSVRRVAKLAAASGSKAAFGAAGILVGSVALATVGRWASCHAAWLHSWALWLAFPDSQVLPRAICPSLGEASFNTLRFCVDEPAVALSALLLLLACAWRPLLHLNLAPAWTRTGLVPAGLLWASGASASLLARHLSGSGGK